MPSLKIFFKKSGWIPEFDIFIFSVSMPKKRTPAENCPTEVVVVTAADGKGSFVVLEMIRHHPTAGKSARNVDQAFSSLNL